jgi:phytoene synthase
MAVLEDYAEGSSATVMGLALRVLGVSGGETTAAEAGIGYALAGLLRAMPFHARAGRCYIPAEIAARAGLDLGDYAALRSTPALRRVVAEIADKAALHLRAARADRREVPRAGLPALLPAVIAERALARLRRAGNDPFDPRLAQPDPLQSWRLLLAMLRGRF